MNRAGAWLEDVASQIVFAATALVRGPADKPAAPGKHTLAGALASHNTRDSIGIGVGLSIIGALIFFAIYFGKGLL